MAMLVNGERIPDALVEEEFARLKRCQGASGSALARSDAQLRLLAACGVVDRILIRQYADRDPRPIDPKPSARRCARKCAAAIVAAP